MWMRLCEQVGYKSEKNYFILLFKDCYVTKNLQNAPFQFTHSNLLFSLFLLSKFALVLLNLLLDYTATMTICVVNNKM